MTAGALSRLRLTAATLRQRLARREDSEHAQALLRIGFGLFISAYLYSTIGPRFDIHVICIGFEVLSWAIFLAIIVRPQRSAWRRGVGAVLDLGTTTYLMWTNGEVGAPLYGIYLWVTFGNGFRYGVRSLYLSHAMSMVGFGSVVAFNPFWHQHALMAGGFLILLAALPFYGAVLLKGVTTESRTDTLTKLANRRLFLLRGSEEVQRARRTHRPFSVLFLDLDNFKSVNDRFGHAAGDALLERVGVVLQAGLRSIDVPARWGGDEFAVLLPETEGDGARLVAESLHQKLKSEFTGLKYPVSSSIGAATFLQPPATFDDAMKCADELMYSIKKGFKDAVAQKDFFAAGGET